MVTNKRYPIIWYLAACCLTVALVGIGLFCQHTIAVTSIVSLDVNPGIELKVNKNKQVLVCEALNTEAEAVLADMNGGADLKGTKLNVAVNAIVGTLMRDGYLDSGSSAILISVEDGDQCRADRLQQELIAEIDTMLLTHTSKAAVFSQTVKKDVALEKQAKENGISVGKASLITRITAMNHELTFETLSALSVDELKGLLESGASAMPIGKDAAVSAAKQYAGVSGLDSIQWYVDAELDDVPACYEVDLYISGAKLEYAVDAYSGKVIRGTPVTVSQSPSKDFVDITGTDKENPISKTTPSSNGAIGRDRAKSIALAHAGLTESQISRLQVEKDGEDGRMVYEIEFKAGNTEYEYTIDAVTGAVLKHEKDWND